MVIIKSVFKRNMNSRKDVFSILGKRNIHPSTLISQTCKKKNSKIIKGIILSTFPPKSPKITLVQILVTSPNVTIESKCGKHEIVKQYSTMLIGYFQPETTFEIGNCVAFFNVIFSLYNEKKYYSADSVKKISDTFTINQFPYSTFFLPMLSCMKSNQMVMFPFEVDIQSKLKDKEGIVAYMDIPESNDKYLFNKKNSDSIISVSSIAITLFQWCEKEQKEDAILINTSLYENHLLQIGITNPSIWVVLIPSLLPYFKGMFFGYISKEDSLNMDYNILNEITPRVYDYALSIKCTSLRLDIPYMIMKSGIEVSKQFIIEKIPEKVIESDYSSSNIYNKKTFISEKNTGSVLNLDEFTGTISFLLDDDTIKYYIIVEPSFKNHIEAMAFNERLPNTIRCTYNLFAIKH